VTHQRRYHRNASWYWVFSIHV